MTPVLSGHDLVRTFRSQRGETRALSEVSVEVPERGAVGIVGESGAGKSTLLRLLLALDSPDSGEIRYRGERLHRRDRGRLRDFRRAVQPVQALAQITVGADAAVHYRLRDQHHPGRRGLLHPQLHPDAVVQRHFVSFGSV